MKYLANAVALAALLFSFSTHASRLDKCDIDEDLSTELIAEHVYGGFLDDQEIDARRAYVLAFNKDYNVPSWVAWHAVKDYRSTPKRKGKWYNFNEDPDFTGPKLKHYKYWRASEQNLVRGHIAPYFIAGGDRDGDGRDAEIESTLKIEDMDDACTVFEINSLANVAPQYHKAFNGSGGLWYELEEINRNLIDDKDKELYFFAGSIFVDGKDVQKIGELKGDPSKWSIGIPHGFFKVVIDPAEKKAFAFLFDHQANIQHGCSMDAELEKCIVSFDELEAVTGMKFFKDLPKAQRDELRGASSVDGWSEWEK